MKSLDMANAVDITGSYTTTKKGEIFANIESNTVNFVPSLTVGGKTFTGCSAFTISGEGNYHVLNIQGLSIDSGTEITIASLGSTWGGYCRFIPYL